MQLDQESIDPSCFAMLLLLYQSTHGLQQLVGRLVANREVPVLKRAKELLSQGN